MPYAIRLDEINSFLDRYLAGKGKSTKSQARIALKHWEKYVEQTKAEHIKTYHIDQFIVEKRNQLKSRTLLPYLFHIAKYFERMDQEQLREHIMKEREKLRLEMRDEGRKVAIHHGVLEMLKAVTNPRDKLILRLLLWSEIPVGCLEKLKVKHVNLKERKYEVLCNDNKTIGGVLYSDIPMIVEEIEKERNLRQEDSLIGINTRQIQNLIPKYAKRVGIPYKVTPLDLREFAQNPARDMLIELYEKEKRHSHWRT